MSESLRDTLVNIIRPKCDSCLGSGTLEPTLYGFGRQCPCPWCNGKGILPPDVKVVEEILITVAGAVGEEFQYSLFGVPGSMIEWLRAQGREKI